MVYYSTVLTGLRVGQRVPYHRPRAALLCADVSRQGRFDDGSITRYWRGNRACLRPCWCICGDPCSLEATEIRSSIPGAQVSVVLTDVRDAQAVNAAVRATLSRFEKIDTVTANAGTGTGLSERTSVLQLKAREKQSISHVA